MKRKILLIFLSVVAAICLALGISACSGNSGNESSGTKTEQSGSISSSTSEDGNTPAATTYTVTYDANGGTFADGGETYTQTVNSGSTLTTPTSPMRESYTFAGWTTYKNGSVMWSFSSDTVTSNITLYASWNEKSASILSVENASIDGTDIFMLVDNTTDSVSLSSKVVCSSDCTWELYYDKLGQTEIPTKIAASTTGSLYNGENLFYMVVTSTDGTQVNVYTLTVYRSYAVAVDYYNGDGLLKTETAYTGYSFTTSYTPTISGYTFNYWKTSSGSKFTEETLLSALTLYADTTVNSYTVTYNVNGGDELSITTKTVTYDSSYTLSVPTRTGYTFSGWYYDSTQLTDGDGESLAIWSYADDTTITAMWTANDFTVTLNLSDNSAGSVSGDGNHAYDSSVTIKAINNVGYTFIGWYDENDELITADASYTFTMGFDVIYIAKFEEDYTALSNFEYTVSGSDYTITGIKDKTVTEIVVPNYATAIEEGAFSGCSNLVSITLPFVGGSIKTSSDNQYPFGYIFGTSSYTGGTSTKQYYYGSITIIDTTLYTLINPTYYIPTTLTTVTISGGNILYGAFQNCTSLTNVTIGDGVTSIDDFAFCNCTSLTSVTIEDGVTSIGDDAFCNCTSLTSVTIGDSVETIGGSAFYKCTSLESITIPDSVTSIGSSAFYDCTSLTSINIPDSVTSIGSSAFYGCTSLTYNEYENGYYLGNDDNKYIVLVKVIDTSVTSFTINEKTKVIYTSVFSACTSLTEITIPGGVTSIGDYAFRNCTSLTSITVDSENIYFKSIDGNLYSYGGTELIQYAIGKTNTSFTIPSSVTSIGDWAFHNCTTLTSITIGSCVTSIGDYAFYWCTSLESITIPGSVTSIGEGAFEICTSLTSITIPDSVTSIGNYAFQNCESLTSVTIGSGVTSIGIYTFTRCSSLTSVTFSDTSGWYYTSSSSYTGGTSISSSSLLSTSTAAKYLTVTYDNKYWYKK